MDRLFSKFQLSDIKVDEGSSFPPDAEAQREDQQFESPPAPEEMPSSAQPAAPPIDAEEPAGDDRLVETTTRAYRPGYGSGVPRDRGEILKVSSRSRPSAVAGAIAGVVRGSGRAEVQAIGAGAANQAIKAVAIARDYLNESLVDLTIDEADRTAIRLVVETR